MVYVTILWRGFQKIPVIFSKVDYVDLVQGITVVTTGESVAILVHELSDELKSLVRDRLAGICYGSADIVEDPEYYSFEKTVEEFLKRYDTKPDSTKIGMAGELIIHSLMPEHHVDLVNTSILFNKEERSIKKGFDLTFTTLSMDELWYGEVKSGRVAKPKPGKEVQSASAKLEQLVATAAGDIHGKLTKQRNRSWWDSAMTDAGKVLQTDDAKSIKKLLRAHSGNATAGEDGFNVLLGAVVMHESLLDKITLEASAAASKKVTDSQKFRRAKLLVVQQETAELLIDFIRTGLGH